MYTARFRNSTGSGCDMFTSFDAAKRFTIRRIKHDENNATHEQTAETLCHLAESVNLEAAPFSAGCLGYHYNVLEVAGD